MDDERKRKIEAGKSKWAEFKKKKNRKIKSNSPPDAVLSRVHEKSCPVDPGGTSNTPENSLVSRQSEADFSHIDQHPTSENLVCVKNITEECKESTYEISALMNSPPEHDSSQIANSPLMDDSVDDRNKPDSSTSLDSLILERCVDEIEVSSGSDNSTITGMSSDSSKSVSSTESESSLTDKSFQVSNEAAQQSHFILRNPNDNRPDEEKVLESFFSEEKEKDVLVEEILVSKENILENISSISIEKLPLESDSEIKPRHRLFEEDKDANKAVTKDIVSSLSENVTISLPSSLDLPDDEDEPVPLFNTDDKELATLFDDYQVKIKKYQEAIQKRDSMISKLSSTLETFMNAKQAANSAGSSQEEILKKEIFLLHLQMKETAELLEKQKLKNGITELENSSSQTEKPELNRYDTGIQVETNISSLLLSCNLDEATFFELFVKKFSSDSGSLHDVVEKLKDLLVNRFSHVHIQELVTSLKNKINVEESDMVEPAATIISNEIDSQNSKKLDSAVILKKIASLNMVAKLIESLINISSGSANEAFSDFSPSKFQSFFLKRLHSMETGDTVTDMSESESVMSDINYAEVETPCNKPVIEPTLTIEKLQRKNISEDFSIVTDFLQEEMEKWCGFHPVPGPHGDGLELRENIEEKEVASGTPKSCIETDHQKISQLKSKLETRLKNLKSLEKELQEVSQHPHHLSMDSDTMTMSDDNIMMEELPLSCISLLSLTDSEYKGDAVTTDSENNFSRKVSLDMSRSMQERDFCVRCERNVDLLREKYENDIISLKEQLEKSFRAEKKESVELVKNLESEITHLRADKDNLSTELNKQIQSLCSENVKSKQLSDDLATEVIELKALLNKAYREKEELEMKPTQLEEKLALSEQKVQEILHEMQKLKAEKAENEIFLQNQIADLIQEHEQDLETLKNDSEAKLNLEKKQLEDNYKTSFEAFKKMQDEEADKIRCQMKKEFEEKEQSILNEHSRIISMIEAAHCDESAGFQKKIEQLLEEKCELLTKTTQEYETILKKNHRALVLLCRQLLAKINTEKQKIANESIQSGVDFNASFSALEQLNMSLENGLVRFLNQNYFMNSNNEEFCLDETEYLPIEMSLGVGEDDLPFLLPMKEYFDKCKKENETEETKGFREASCGPRLALSESSLDSDNLAEINAEITKLQEEFHKDVTFYKDVNNQLHLVIKNLRRQNQELEDQKESFEARLQEKEKELIAKESLLSAMDAAAVKGGSQLSATDIRSWQVQTAQTNSRLLHVLSDLVKTFLDIEQDINSHLREYGLIPSRSGTQLHHDDDTGQSVGSREDFASLSLGECPNLELTEDGPDLTPRAWDVFAAAGNYEADLEGEDVVLGASRRLRLAVDHVLHLLSRALENHQNQDFKLLLKRNEELSHDLQEESQGRDAVHMELVTAESSVRKLESEKLRLDDLIRDLKDDNERLKRELIIERNKISHLQQDKESAFDEIHTLKDQCELLASRLGDPERTENDKMLNSSGTSLHENSELLKENSRLSSEKQTVQKSLCKERQSFLDRLHQMELAIEELNAEKDDLEEKKCKEIRDLKAEMEAMDKQLQSNKKFIEEQAIEREQEREEFLAKINKMEEFVKEKERIQSSEAQLTREIDSLEDILRARIEDHQNAMMKKDEVEKELRQSMDKIRDLQDVIQECERQLDIKTKIEVDLRQKLAVYESIPNQDKNSSLSDSDSSKNVSQNRESIEQLHNLKEHIASKNQEIEMMSQSETLLKELRGQLHFLEAKVEQRARHLESCFLSASSSPIQSGATSPSSSHDSESLQIPCEDGWEMSPRSIHWLEVRKLEEKIGRLIHMDEELLKKNKEVEQQLKKMKTSYSEYQHENAALQEKVSEQLVQISALKSHIDEQKHRCSTPQKSHTFAEKIEDLQEQLEKQIENNKRLMSDYQDAESSLNVLRDEIRKKEEIIALLQERSETESKKDKAEDDLTLSNVENLKSQVAEINKILHATEKENEELRSSIESLKTENLSLKELLEKAEREVETERAQVETLCEEMASLAENSKEGAMSLNNSNCNDSNEPTFIGEDLGSKPISLENHMKEKNLEILMLKATVTKLESSLQSAEQQLEFEKVLVETLQQELGSLTSYQKRLEQDFNTVQDMMLQKEKELATLHEETEAQLKFEAEIESLEKKLSDQKNIESELRDEIEELENQLEIFKNFQEKFKDKDLYIQKLKEDHVKELNNLNKQIDVLKKFATVTDDDADIQELVNKIMEAEETFKANGTAETFQEILVNLLKNSIDLIIKKLKQNHEEHISSVNKSWQQKINEEISNKQNIFACKTEKLQKTFQQEKEKINAERDAFWQAKIQELETKLKNEQVKCKKKSDRAKETKSELQSVYDEINSLKENLESVIKEKISLENIVKDLELEIANLKLFKNDPQDMTSKQYDAKLTALSKTIKESFESEKQKLINEYQQRVDQLQKELNLKLEQEKNTEVKHKEELKSVHNFFETRWTNEMKKVRDFQTEDLKRLKSNNEKYLEDKLNKAKEEFADLFAKERRQLLQKHENEMEQMLQKFEKEKKELLEAKERAVNEATELLEKKFNQNLVEIQKNLALSKNDKLSEEQQQKRWQEEKLKLISSHRKALVALKQELKNKYEKQLQAQSAVHNAELKRLEETYNKQVEEVNELIKEKAACKSGYPEAGSNRTTTPSSDMTSSDEACSSCQEDMLSINKHILVDKIHQDGKRVLSLVESSMQPFASVKEAHMWLEERKWIVNKLKLVAPVVSHVNLKMVIHDLIEEVQKFRRNFEEALKENSDLKQKNEDLEQELSIQYSKIYDVNSQLKQEKASNSVLESALSMKTSELSELNRKLVEMSRLVEHSAEKGVITPNSRSTGSSSYEVGCFRSADEPKSSEKFSMFLPEINDTPPPSESKTPNYKVSNIQEISTPKFDTPPPATMQSNPSVDVGDTAQNEAFEVKNSLMAAFNKGIDSTDIKLHGLYWVFRKSQSYNRALIYQKRYLLMLLRGFQATEKQTWNFLKAAVDESTITDSSFHPLSRFRSAVFVIIAVERMKVNVRRWRLLARIPPSHLINSEIKSVFRNYTFLSPCSSPGYHLSSHSLASVPFTLPKKDFRSSQTSSSSRAENNFENPTTPDKSQLIEYVHRLEILQKQLGLDSLR